MNNRAVRRWATSLVPVMVVAFVGGYWFRTHNSPHFAGLPAQPLGTKVASAGDPPKPPVVPYDLLSDVLHYLDQQYVDEIKDQTPLTYGMLRGMAAYFDDPSMLFLEPADVTRYKEAQSGKFTGIGATVAIRRVVEPITDPSMQHELKKLLQQVKENADDDQPPGFTESSISKAFVTIVAPVPGGPADKAGILPGDRLDSIDGKWVVSDPFSLELLELQTAVRNNRAQMKEYEEARVKLEAKLKGAFTPTKALAKLLTADKPMKLKVIREGQPGPIEVTVSPGPSTESAVKSVALGKGMGYIRIANFGEEAPDLARSAVHSLRNVGCTKFVIDVRDNAGGRRAEMLDILGNFVGSGTVANLQLHAKSDERAELKTKGSEPPSGQLVVIVNRGTSNLAEVFAAALRDKRGAKLIGTRTAGDAFAHELMDMPDGSGMMVTTGKYFTARGTDFSEVGLQPDTTVDAAARTGPPDTDAVVTLAKAALVPGGKSK